MHGRFSKHPLISAEVSARALHLDHPLLHAEMLPCPPQSCRRCNRATRPVAGEPLVWPTSGAGELHLAGPAADRDGPTPRVPNGHCESGGLPGDRPLQRLPNGPTAQATPILLPKLDAVVANPPYVRQEKVSKTDKNKMKVIAENAPAVADYKAGKKQSLTFLTGQVMRLTRGRANPGLVNELLLKNLEGKNADLS